MRQLFQDNMFWKTIWNSTHYKVSRFASAVCNRRICFSNSDHFHWVWYLLSDKKHAFLGTSQKILEQIFFFKNLKKIYNFWWVLIMSGTQYENLRHSNPMDSSQSQWEQISWGYFSSSPQWWFHHGTKQTPGWSSSPHMHRLASYLCVRSPSHRNQRKPSSLPKTSHKMSLPYIDTLPEG